MDIALSRNEIMHAAIGGGICFLMLLILTSITGFLELALYQVLQFFGILGIVVFESYAMVRLSMIFVPIYFISGFLGGLYTGHFTEKEAMNIKLLITGGIGSIGFLLLVVFFGNLSLLSSLYLELLVFPILGSIGGAYLGGYTVKKPGESDEEVESLSFKVHLEE